MQQTLIVSSWHFFIWQEKDTLLDVPIFLLLCGDHLLRLCVFLSFFFSVYNWLLNGSLHSLFLSYLSLLSQHIQLFCHIMVGNHDAATFRYLLLIGDFIDRIDWKFVEDFKTFASLIYPFLNVSVFFFLTSFNLPCYSPPHSQILCERR